MSSSVDVSVCVIIPNLNGASMLTSCIDSLLKQTLKPQIIVVDNGSTDESAALIEHGYPTVELIKHDRNKGYAGGINPGFKRAIELNADYVATFNNDAVADSQWLEKLTAELTAHPKMGIAACTILHADGKTIDSTGEGYTTWGLPFPRGRDEIMTTARSDSTDIFAASGGASLYRVSMLKEIGLFDEDFFAYYEDVDLSFRAQLAGWKVSYVPAAIVRHETGSTGGKINGFYAYQTMKNQPLLLYKNVPRKYLWRIGWRFFIAHSLFFGRAVSRGQFWPAIKGDAQATGFFFTKYQERKHIQKSRTVSDDYIWSMLVHDLPPNAHALRKLRDKYWKFIGRHE